MSKLRIGTLTIGQAPRPDLVKSLKARLPHAEIIEVGALDGLTASDLPSAESFRPDDYLLTTRLVNGELVTVPEAYLIPKMAEGLKRLEKSGVKAIYLLCAGTFAELKSDVPLLKPFVLAHELLSSMGLKKIGIIAPIPEQERPIRERWEGEGFDTTVWSADVSSISGPLIDDIQSRQQQNRFQALVLDYVGHPAEVSQKLQLSLDIPVLDFGEIAVATLISICELG